MMNLKVVCINDKNRPESIPLDRWVKKDKEYTIIEINKMNIQGGILGCKLAEINNDDLFPYSHFSLERFAMYQPPSKKELAEADLLVEELLEGLEVVSA
jgi:hypothetical protein